MEKTKFLRGDLLGLNQLITRFSVNGIALESVMALLAFKDTLSKITKDAQEYLEMAAKTVDGDFITIQSKYMMEEVEVEFTPIADKDLMKAATGCEAMNVGSLELIREKLTIKNKEDGNNN